MKKKLAVFLVGGALVLGTQINSAKALDVNQKMSMEGTLTGTYQYAIFNSNTKDDFGVKNTGKGTTVLDLGINLHPTKTDEFQLTLSYASGNALNEVDPFPLSTYADDLEADLYHINGRDRNNLLEAWYKKTIKVPGNASLSFTFGIIDSTVYIDDNAYANDEVSQFMNDAFVNNPIANLPSYDMGGVLEFSKGAIDIKALAMNTKNDDDRNYNYYALQLGYTLDTPWGEGTYRIFGFYTSKAFAGNSGLESLKGVGISCDQELTKNIGAFARWGWQKDDANVDYTGFYSFGVSLNGNLWGRSKDVAGIGYAYLDGAKNSSIACTHVLEAYVKFSLFEKEDVSSDLTFDFQAIKNRESGKDYTGTFYGVRWNTSF
ncbi:MAG: carbohydrate porin [Thermodesulfobacteria bacterium]|nr:carbohydrate porin [Thermodesulfobacteriota bacterium]